MVCHKANRHCVRVCPSRILQPFLRCSSSLVVLKTTCNETTSIKGSHRLQDWFCLTKNLRNGCECRTQCYRWLDKGRLHGQQLHRLLALPPMKRNPLRNEGNAKFLQALSTSSSEEIEFGLCRKYTSVLRSVPFNN